MDDEAKRGGGGEEERERVSNPFPSLALEGKFAEGFANKGSN